MTLPKLPQHNNPATQERQARAPYNFVPLPEKVATIKPEELPLHSCYDSNRFTGRIEVKLTTASPLYIRTGMLPEDFANGSQSPEFFHLNNPNNPVIPGSSLRGMLRSMVEIVSYGKVQPVSERQLIYRAVGDRSSLGDGYREKLLGQNKSTNRDRLQLDYPLRNIKGGYLKRYRGEWFIQPAREYEGESFIHVEYNQARPIIRGQGRQRVHDVYVTPARRGSSQRAGLRGGRTLVLDIAITPAINATSQNVMVPAKLVESGHMHSREHSKHWHCAIYEPNPALNTQPAWIPIPDKMRDIYKEDCKIPRSGDRITRELQNDGDPLFYLVDARNQLVFFGSTMMFRLPYANTPANLLPEELHRNTDIDFAEAIFGYVGLETKDKSNESRAGRVFFSEARLAAGQQDIFISQQAITPKILSGPKPTTFQHYLTQQQPNDWKTLDHYAESTPHQTVIRGHKLYWHKGPNPAIENDNSNAGATQLTQIKPLKPDVSFTFIIRFENLSLTELGALMWPLKLGADPAYRLKLGMGKPLGMGAVKTEATLHLTTRPARYSSLFAGDGWQLGQTNDGKQVSDEAIDDFKAFIKKHSPNDTFDGESRIGQLKALLSWPGPNVNETEYMTDLKEFRERKVLPTPTHVWNSPKNSGVRQGGSPTRSAQNQGGQRPQGNPLANRSTPPTAQSQRPAGRTDQPASQAENRPTPPPAQGQKSAVQGQTNVQVASKSSIGQTQPQSAATNTSNLPKIGDIFTGVVENIKPNGTVIVRYKDKPIKQVRGQIPQSVLGGKQYAINSPARCEVIKVYEEFGVWILECKPGPKKEKK